MSESAFDIREDELLCDLQLASLFILQKKQGFRFGFDAVALADFSRVRRNERVMDLGTGTGVLPLLLYGRETTALFDALELQDDMADMAARSMAGNGLKDSIHVRHGDLRRARSMYPAGAYTLVVCNPPYLSETTGRGAPEEKRLLSAAEACCTLRDVLDAASYLLKNGGRFCACLPPKRMAEALLLMAQAGIEPKRLRFVHSRPEKDARLMLMEGVRGGKSGLIVSPPLMVADANNQETDEILRMYHRTE